MQRTSFAFLFLFIVLTGCDIEKRERILEERTNEVIKREQALQLKEEALLLQQQELDSISNDYLNDSLLQVFPLLMGNWNVKMLCSETTCPGSAIGDSKTEQWEFVMHDNILVAIAISNNKLSRIYTGDYAQEQITMESQSDTTTKILINLKFDKDNLLKGTRKIIRKDDCHITYDLTLKK